MTTKKVYNMEEYTQAIKDANKGDTIIFEEVAELPDKTPKGEQQIDKIINNMKTTREVREEWKRSMELK